MKRKLVMLSAVLLCTGCAKAENVHYNSVEETVTTESHAVPETTSVISGEEETLNKDELSSFVKEDCLYKENKEEKFYDSYTDAEYGIFIKKVQVSDHLETFGEPFMEWQSKIEEAVRVCEQEVSYTYNGSPLMYLCVEAELTNYADETKSPCLFNFMNLRKCVIDERGKNYGLPETKIEIVMPYTEFWVDCTKQQNQGKQAYFIDMEPGETVPVRCLYIIPQEELSEDIYMELVFDTMYDAKKKCQLATDKVKLLKLPQIEEV